MSAGWPQIVLRKRFPQISHRIKIHDSTTFSRVARESTNRTARCLVSPQNPQEFGLSQHTAASEVRRYPANKPTPWAQCTHGSLPWHQKNARNSTMIFSAIAGACRKAAWLIPARREWHCAVWGGSWGSDGGKTGNCCCRAVAQAGFWAKYAEIPFGRSPVAWLASEPWGYLPRRLVPSMKMAQPTIRQAGICIFSNPNVNS